MANSKKPAAPRSVPTPRATTIGDNLKVIYAGVREAAATATMGRAMLTLRISEAVAQGLGDDASLRALQREAYIGAVAAKHALANGRTKPAAGDFAEAAVILKRAGHEKKANAFGVRTADQERWYGAARVMWSGACADAGLAKNEAKAQAGKETAAKRKARAGAAATTTTKGATKKAKGAPADQTTSTTPTIAVPAEALAWVMAEAARIKTFAERNAKALGAERVKAVKDAVSVLLSLSMPE